MTPQGVRHPGGAGRGSSRQAPAGARGRSRRSQKKTSSGPDLVVSPRSPPTTCGRTTSSTRCEVRAVVVHTHAARRRRETARRRRCARVFFSSSGGNGSRERAETSATRRSGRRRARSKEGGGRSETSGRPRGESISQDRRVFKVARRAKRQGTPGEAGGSFRRDVTSQALRSSEGQA